jgi:amino acid transporter
MSERSGSRGGVGGGSSLSAAPTLKREAVGLPGLTFQGITHMAPAVGIALSAPFVASFAGAAFPLAWGLAGVLAVIIALSMAQLAKHIPSAGGMYTFVARGLGAKTGFLTGWLYFLYDPLVPTFCTVLVGQYVQATLQSLYGLYFPWWAFTLLVFAGLFAVTYLGIRASIRAAIFLSLAEVLITLALSLTVFARQGISAHALQFGFTLAGIPGDKLHGLLFAMIFSFLSYTGFEATIPLTEEARNPRQILTPAMMIGVIGIVIYYVVFSFASVVGFGVDATASGKFAAAANPYFNIGQAAWGGIGPLIVLLAIINSGWGCSLGGQNALIRVLYSMGRAGVLPRPLGRVHPRYQSPYVATIVQTIYSVALGMGFGFWLGPVNTAGVMGGTISISLLFVYGLVLLAVPVYYRRERPGEGHWVLVRLLPILGILMLLPVLYGSVYPLPAFPLNLPAFFVIGWFIIGVAIVSYLARRKPEALAAGRIAFEEEEPPPMPAGVKG